LTIAKSQSSLTLPTAKEGDPNTFFFAFSKEQDQNYKKWHIKGT